MRKIVASTRRVSIPVRSQASIPVKHAELLQSRDFIFEPCNIPSSQLTLYAHMVDETLHSIIVENDSDQPIDIARNTRLGNICELEFDNCYFVD